MHRIVGLDWGQDGLRVATLQGGFRGFAIEEVRSAPLPAEGLPAEKLKAALDELGLSPPLGPDDAVAVALPSALSASHLITLPFTDQKRIEQVLPAEVENAIPFDLAEVVWDYAVLSQGNGKTEVLVGVVRKSALKELLASLASCGIDPRVVTLGPLALAALAEKGLLGGGPSGTENQTGGPTAAILDAGPDRADLALLEEGKPVLARALASALAPQWQAATTDEGARNRIFQTLARDLKITLRTRTRGMQPAKIYLAGFIAGLQGAQERIAQELQIPAESIPLPGNAPPDTALALGLAVRAQNPRGRINFRKGEFAFTKDLSQVRGQVGRLAIACAVLLVLALGLGLARLTSLNRQAAAYDEAVCTATKRILGTCLTDYRQALGQLSGGKSKAAGIPRVSAADVLAEVVAHMPEGTPPLLEDTEITTLSVRLKGSAESFGRVDEIIASLKKDKCFGEIKQPRVEKQRDGTKINFSLDFPYVCSGETAGGA